MAGLLTEKLLVSSFVGSGRFVALLLFWVVWTLFFLLRSRLSVVRNRARQAQPPLRLSSRANYFEKPSCHGFFPTLVMSSDFAARPADAENHIFYPRHWNR